MAEPVRTRYAAPWSSELFLVTGLGMFAIGVPIVAVLLRGEVIIGTALSLLVVSLACLTVRGYEITPAELLIRRSFWVTRWPLYRPTQARVQPGAMAGSWRLWGNAGMFAVTGLLSNRQLGRYHAYATDFSRTVVIETPKGLLVVSPDSPQAFVAAIRDVTALS